MGKRTDALVRVWTLLYQSFIGYLLLSVVGIVALVWMIVDVIWQLIVGSDGLSAGSGLAMQVEMAFDWSVNQTVYALTGGGDGSFRWFWTM